MPYSRGPYTATTAEPHTPPPPTRAQVQVRCRSLRPNRDRNTRDSADQDGYHGRVAGGNSCELVGRSRDGSSGGARPLARRRSISQPRRSHFVPKGARERVRETAIAYYFACHRVICRAACTSRTQVPLLAPARLTSPEQRDPTEHCTPTLRARKRAWRPPVSAPRLTSTRVATGARRQRDRGSPWGTRRHTSLVACNGITGSRRWGRQGCL